MTIHAMLAPAAVLVLWTTVMLMWVLFTRFPAFKKVGIDIGKAGPGGRGSDVEPMLPASVNWKSHNHTHLHEQPTIFYAVVLILAVAPCITPLTVGLAWAYVGLRIAHSLWQALVNTIPVRFALFFLSSCCLIALAVLAVLCTLNV